MLEVPQSESKYLTSTIKEYKTCLKDVPEILNSLIYRPIAFPFVKIAQWFKLTPNFCTLISLLSALLSAWQFLHLNYLAAAFFLFFKQVFDCVDGSLARLTNQTSKSGEILDIISDLIGALLILTALGFGLYQLQKNLIVFIWVYAIFFGSSSQVLFFNHVKDRYLIFYNGVNRALQTGSPKVSPLPLNNIQRLAKQGLRINPNLVIFPDITQQIIIDQQILPFSEKQKLFQKYFFWLTQLWSLIAGAAVSSWLLILTLLKNPLVLLFIVFVVNPLLIGGLLILQRILVNIFNKRYLLPLSKLN